MNKNINIILASNSKKRKSILDMLNLKYEIIKSNEEEISNKRNPCEYTMELSFNKTNNGAKRIDKPSIIIGADTIYQY